MGFSLSLPLSLALGFRLKLLMSGQKIFLPIKDLMYLTFIGFFFNNFLPTAIGGDIVKAYYAAKKTNNKAGSFAAIVADRLIGFLSVFSIATIGIIFIGKELNNNKIIWVIAMMLVLLILVILILFNKNGLDKFLPNFVVKNSVLINIKKKLSKLQDALNFYKHSAMLLIKAYVFGILMQACTILSIYFFILCLGGDLPILKLFLIIPVVWTISMLPSLNGLGVREGAFVYFLKGDIGADVAFMVSMLWLGMIILYSIVGGLLHLLYPVKAEVKEEVLK